MVKDICFSLVVWDRIIFFMLTTLLLWMTLLLLWLMTLLLLSLTTLLLLLMTSMMRPRLQRSESQRRDRDRDQKCLSLSDETETKTENVSMTRPRLKMSESQWRGRDWKNLSLNDETGQKMSIPRPHWDSHRFLLLQLVGRRMISMPWNEFCMIICGCWDWDSSGLGYMLDVETKTHRD